MYSSYRFSTTSTRDDGRINSSKLLPLHAYLFKRPELIREFKLDRWFRVMLKDNMPREADGGSSGGGGSGGGGMRGMVGDRG